MFWGICLSVLGVLMSFSYFLIEHRDCTAHRVVSAPRVMETKKQKTAENVTTTRTLLVGKKRIHLSSHMANVPGPLPESLRKGVYEAYGQLSYGAFMRHQVLALSHTLLVGANLVIGNVLFTKQPRYGSGSAREMVTVRFVYAHVF